MAATQVAMTDTLRRATIEDADNLSSLGARTFTETFAHLYPPEDLRAFLAEAYGLERTRADLAHPRKASWLVESDGQVVGYATAGTCELPHPDVQPKPKGQAGGVPLPRPELQPVFGLLGHADGRDGRHPEQDSPGRAAG